MSGSIEAIAAMLAAQRDALRQIARADVAIVSIVFDRYDVSTAAAACFD